MGYKIKFRKREHTDTNNSAISDTDESSSVDEAQTDSKSTDDCNPVPEVQNESVNVVSEEISGSATDDESINEEVLK